MKSKKNIKKTKGQMSFQMILMILAVIFLIGAGTMYARNTDRVSKSTADLSCVKSADHEGPKSLQLSRGDCPCDVDDRNNPSYVGKFYTVNKDRYTKSSSEVKEFLTDKYILELQKKSFKISQKDVEAISKYITKNYELRGNRAVGEMKGVIILSPDLNIYLNYPEGQEKKPHFVYNSDSKLQDFAPTMKILCPSLKDNPKLCQKEIFMKDWFGENAKLECKTSRVECNKLYKEICSVSKKATT